MDQNPSHSSVFSKLVGAVGASYLHLVGRTSFVRTESHASALALRRERRPAIYAFWHNTQAFLAYHHRGERVGIMVSRSRDGDAIAGVMHRLGLRAVRGSSSRGGAAALREVVERLGAGEQVGFTPDGPRGPVHRVQGGVVYAAQRSGAPIIPTTVFLTRRLVFRSWDRFMLPLPFGRVVVAHGAPFTLPESLSQEEAAAEVRRRIDEAREVAAVSAMDMPGWWSLAVGRVLLGVYRLLSVVLIPVWAPVVALRFGWKRSRKYLRERWGRSLPRLPEGKKRLWFHAASVGEWRALRPVVERLLPVLSRDWTIFVTVSTPEARAVIEKEDAGVLVGVLPLDVRRVVGGWVDRVRPDAAAFVETEIWPNLVLALHARHIPIFVLNGRLSRRSVRRWRLVLPFIRYVLGRVGVAAVRTERDGRHFCSLGVPAHRIHITSNTKCDNMRILTWEEKRARREEVLGEVPGVVLAAGSVWPGEEGWVLDAFRALQSEGLRLVFAPRRLERVSAVERMLHSRGLTYDVWSGLSRGHWQAQVLLVDTMGDLGTLYGACDVAYVGGSLIPVGGQNPLEPAVARCALLFGPYMDNFHEEALALKRAGGARTVRHVKDLILDAGALARDTDLRRLVAERAAETVRSMQGASDRTVALLRDQLGFGR